MAFVTKKYTDDGLKTKVNKAWVRVTNGKRRLLTSVGLDVDGTTDVVVTSLGSDAEADANLSSSEKISLKGIVTKKTADGVELDAAPTLDSAKEYADDTFVRIDDYPEYVSNKVTALTAASTDDEYPTAKAVYDKVSAIRTEAVQYQGSVDYFGAPTNKPATAAPNVRYLTTTGELYKFQGGSWSEDSTFKAVENGFLYDFSHYTDSVTAPQPAGWVIFDGKGGWSIRVDAVNAVDDDTIGRRADSTLYVKPNSLDEDQFTQDVDDALELARGAFLKSYVWEVGNGRKQLLECVELSPSTDEEVTFTQYSTDVTGTRLDESFALRLAGGPVFDIDATSLTIDCGVEYDRVF